MRGGHGARAAGVALASAVLLAALPGCGSDGDELVIYSGRTRNLIGPLLEDFADETGISISVRYDNSANLALLLDEEGDRTDADVFISQSPGAVGFLDEGDRLEPLPDETLALVSEGDAAQDGSWIGLSGRVRTLVYNTDLVEEDELPDSVLDLTGDDYAGRVALAPTNASFQDFVTVLRGELGEDDAGAWLEGMAAGNPPTYNDNTSIVEAVGRGEVPMGLVNHYYAFVARDENPDLPVDNHYFPDGDLGSTLLVTAASIVAGTDREDEARRFVEFMLSEDAQSFFSNETFEFPLAPGAEPNPALPPLETIAATRVDLGALGSGLEATADLIDDSGLTS
jgi:iron(III) transport system substrate-binding protein